MQREPGTYRLLTHSRHTRFEGPKGDKVAHYEMGDHIELSAHELRAGGDFPISRVDPVTGPQDFRQEEIDHSSLDYMLDGNVSEVKDTVDENELDISALKYLKRLEGSTATKEDREPRKGVIEYLEAKIAKVKQSRQASNQ